MTETQILEDAFSIAQQLNNTQETRDTFSYLIVEAIDVLIDKIDSNKSLLSALVTSIVKKIICPTQDIRLHRTDFENGYSARSLDTNVTAPFFKQHFPKYANKESAFLTLATRERIRWTLEEGSFLKIRNKEVKNAFLSILNALENRKVDTKECLAYIFVKLIELSAHHYAIFDKTIESLSFTQVINIDIVLQMLQKHFETKLSSRLPVIAIYAAYQELFKQIKRFEGKKLALLNTHTSSDKHGYGDIDILNNDGTYFESVEIKHGIPINKNHIFDIAKKCENSTVEKYYILTTYKGSFENKEEELFIKQFVLKIQQDSGLKIIANGIIDSLKYYLRFIDNYQDYLKTYTESLIADAQTSTEIKDFHLTEWQLILHHHQIQ